MPNFRRMAKMWTSIVVSITLFHFATSDHQVADEDKSLGSNESIDYGITEKCVRWSSRGMAIEFKCIAPRGFCCGSPSGRQCCDEREIFNPQGVENFLDNDSDSDNESFLEAIGMYGWVMVLVLSSLLLFWYIIIVNPKLVRTIRRKRYLASNLKTVF